MALTRTRFSFFYLAGYLYAGGLGLLFVPDMVFEVFLSNGSYGDTMPRLAGVLMLALGILITQMIRLKVEGLYPPTVAARSLILATLVWLYLRSGDPMMLVLLGIVGLGFVLTLASYLADRKRSPS